VLVFATGETPTDAFHQAECGRATTAVHAALNILELMDLVGIGDEE
jgi:hypothetical protein